MIYVPKYRQKILCGKFKRRVVDMFRDLCRQRNIDILEGHLMPGQVHICLKVPEEIHQLVFNGNCRIKQFFSVTYIDWAETPCKGKCIHHCKGGPIEKTVQERKTAPKDVHTVSSVIISINNDMIFTCDSIFSFSYAHTVDRFFEYLAGIFPLDNGMLLNQIFNPDRRPDR